MIITYFRSSSYNTHSMCEQQYFFEYVLGYRGPSNQKADKGTIVHKVLEILAFIKQAEQNNEKIFIDDIIGEINVSKYNLDKIIDKIYEYYTSKFNHHKWTSKDLEDCRKWTNKAIDYNNGMFDPRNRDIVSPEQHFDFTIEQDWAKYIYKNDSGYLGLKGTIDLITKIDDNTLEIIDWKTGRRLDWATGKEKTQEKLEDDPQLRIYHYAVNHLYPEIEHIMVTIFFINDGGPFSVSFDRSDLIKTEKMLKDKFEIIKKSKKPKLNRSWICNKLCHFGKTTFENSNILPIVEYRDNQVCSKDTFMTKCEQVKHDIELKGIDSVVDEYTVPGYTVSRYKAPGSVE
jgi:CRISPR/Cas system-associated exonuclease Cas4 (RecB family)/uncharacterized protein YozE (UPF0346 family)